MPTPESLNCEDLRQAFEEKEAIYLDKGVLHVRVTSVYCNVKGRLIVAKLEEIPTPGLERSLFHLRRPEAPSPLHLKISAGFMTEFSDQTWHMGYGGWSLFVAPEIVSGFVRLASEWPPELDAHERYNQAVRYLNQCARVPTKHVFPDSAIL